MATEQSPRRLDLEAKIRVLREENFLLAEQAEEAMLLRTIAEIASWSNDQDTLLNQVLERISILRNVSLCACGLVSRRKVAMDWCYSSLDTGDCSIQLQMSPALLTQIEGRNECVISLPSSECHFELGGSERNIQSLLLIGFHTHLIPQGVFLFGSEDARYDWSAQQFFLRQAVEKVAVRLDRLGLVGELQQINHELDKRVRERTAELQERNQELSSLRRLLENVMNSMPSVLVTVDAENRILQWNREAAELSGTSLTEARGKLLSEAFPGLCEVMPDGAADPDKQQVLQRKRALLKIPGGDPLLVDISVYPLHGEGDGGAVIRADNVAEQARLEEIMIQAEKMLSVGGLAAGMAHEINNPLAGILQNLQVVENRLVNPLRKNLEAATELGLSFENIKAYIEQRDILSMVGNAIQSGRRAAAIVENILSFSRQAESKKSPQDLIPLLEKTLDLLDNDYNFQLGYDFRKIQIVRELEEGLPPVPCEETKIQQVLLNILQNAAQAMRSHEAQEPCRLILRLSRQGDMAQIEICDNGPGIEVGLQRRIFEPFYTTKGGRGGTGLGLSVSYFIVSEQHGGELLVEPAAGGGCCFIIRLPFAK